MSINVKPVYQRVLLKLSGEVLQGSQKFGVDVVVLDRIAKEIKKLVELGVQVAIVIGGGNLFRGSELSKFDINRVVGDYIGMLSTVINGLIIFNALQNVKLNAYLMSAIPIDEICNPYNWCKSIRLLCSNNVVIFTSGTGNPFFTTDSAACLRGIEIKADIVLKATKVDGVFSTDPMKYPDATFYDRLTYQDVLNKELKVMDLAAFTLARDHGLPICVFNINKCGALCRVIMGRREGTLITK